MSTPTKTVISVRPVMQGKANSNEAPKVIVAIRTGEIQHHPEWAELMRGDPKSQGTRWHPRGTDWIWQTG
jgi:hypothetical protein